MGTISSSWWHVWVFLPFWTEPWDVCLRVDESDLVGVMVTLTFYLQEQENGTRGQCCDFSLTMKCRQKNLSKGICIFYFFILHGLTCIEWSYRNNLLKGIWMNPNLWTDELLVVTRYGTFVSAANKWQIRFCSCLCMFVCLLAKYHIHHCTTANTRAKDGRCSSWESSLTHTQKL